MASRTLTLARASIGLNDLIQSLRPGDEIVLTDNDEPIARILPARRSAVANESDSPHPATAATWAGKVRLSDDSDDVILEHFRDYLP